MCLTDVISASIVNDCDNLAIAGIEADVVIIPHKLFDKTSSTVNASNRMLLDALELLTVGDVGFKIEGVKQLNGFLSEFVPNEDSLDRWRHTFDGRIMTPNAANRLQASKLTKGESYLVIVHRKYKGANNADAFLILGYDQGLEVTAMTENSRENDGAFLFTLASKDTRLEYDMPRNLLIGDYAATLTAFGNLFVQS